MVHSFLKDKRVVVTGACGTIGSELSRQILEDYGAGELIALDTNEGGLYFMQHDLGGHPSQFLMADVRDKDKLLRCFRGADIVFHTAAYKHVVMCERSPFEAVQTNILGVQNVVTAAAEANVPHVLFTSSDKAVNPTNVMGTSKLMGERLVTAANTLEFCDTRFTVTRFGNVLGSRGSVIPVFRNQIRNCGPVTLTDPLMTRFIMSVKQAVHLVVESCAISNGGEVFVTKMPVVRIVDLAEVMIRELAPCYGHDPEDIEIKIVGAMPGEKLFEELMTEEECGHCWELEDYFAVMPALRTLYSEKDFTYPGVKAKSVPEPYNSRLREPLTQDELLDFLTENGLLLEGSEDDHRSPRYPYADKA